MSRYVLGEHLHDGAVFSLDRARDAVDGVAVVLKRLTAERSEPSERARLRREYELLRRLDLPGVVQVRSLEEDAGELRLVLTDIGGESLDVRLARGPLPLAEFLDLALQLAAIVDRVHRCGVLHKDIKPRNILVTPGGRVQLIDFGIATEAPRELAVAAPPQVLEGTPAYIAPEQTGRMNRPVDARSDLYSLGATFYEMLTGRTPFVADDPAALVHCQIARAPTPPAELEPAIPPVLSDMVLKLLAKQAEDRYQSASGLHHDLELCRERLAGGATIESFPLGERDAPARFEPPARLYGRAAELAALTAALARVRLGGCELVRVGGPAGIGKSALIGELAREVAACGGRVLTGKFEALAHDLPYGALRGALVGLVEALLAEPEVALARRRVALERTLGRLRFALLDLLPELAAVIGPAPRGSSDGDSPGAARGRLLRAVRGFVGLFAAPETPLALVLDDLQWADAASIDLLAALLGPERPTGLLVVVSTRDEPLGPALLGLLSALEQSGVAAPAITLGPLTAADTLALVTDTVRRPQDEAAPLAALVHERTGGVPLLVAGYLRDLAEHDLVVFDPVGRRWTWDLAAITGAAISADVVSHMVERTRSIDQALADALARAACLGAEFDAGELAALVGRPEDEVAAGLVTAARAGLVVPGGGRYRFSHDRVRQALVAALAEPERAAIHLSIGRGLRIAGVDDGHPRLFEVVRHLNAAATLVGDPEERGEVAALDLAAALRARAAGAFAAVADYAAAGLEFLGPSARVQAPRAWFDLALLRAEGLFLAGEHAAAEAALGDMLEKTADREGRARVFELWAALDLHAGRLRSTIEHGCLGLEALGEAPPRTAGIPAVLVEFLRTRAALGRRAPEDLLALPPLTDARVRLALRLYFVILGATFQIDPLLTAALTMRAARLTLAHGTSSLSAAQLLSYGLMVGLIGRDVAGMERYGALALALLERHPDRGVEAVVKFLYGVMIQPWSHPFARTLPILRDAMQAGVDSGQLFYAGVASVALGSNRFAGGGPLEQVRQDVEATRALGRTLALDLTVDQSVPLGAVVGALTGVALAEDGAPQRDDPMMQLAAAIWGSFVHLVMGRFAEGLVESDAAEPTVAQVLGQMTSYADHVFTRAMLLAARGPSAGPFGALRLRRAVDGAARRFAGWAARCPANFDARTRLLRAELARLEGDGAAAIRGYEDAVTCATRDGRPQDEGLACEAAARFLTAAGAADAARVYLRRARRAYLRWGALAKVEQLDHLHPSLERREAGDPRDSSQTREASTVRALHLDFASIFKATQLFAEELAIDRLLASVMRIVVENAGAQRGVLLLARADGLVGAHEYVAADERHADLAEAPLAALDRVPAGLVLLAHRAGRPVVVDDAGRDPRLEGDPYLARVRLRSLLAAPLVHGGVPLGVVYLENNLAAGVFTPERAEAMRLLAVQAAIAIDRALLFGRLDEARRAAESASVAKSRFLANMSHELRTPLNAILGYCELIEEDARANGLDDLLADLARIQRAGRHLLAIVRDILDLTKIEAGRLDAQREPVALTGLLGDVVAVITPEVARRGNRLHTAWSGDLGEIVTDPTLLRQVLINLLGNAAKFTRDGDISLQVERTSDRVRFAVEDTGIGMNAAELRVVFEPFTQADAAPTRRYGGVGLGLTISRRIVEALGGTLDVSSEPGRGSRFVVALPAAGL